MNDPQLAPIFAKGARLLMWLGASSMWFVLGLYFYKFGPGNWFELSSSQEVWSFFGSFVGGLLGPYFALLASIGVLITIVLQARQLDIVRAQAEFEEFQRVMTGISTRLDDLLAKPPTSDVSPLSTRSMFELIASLGMRQLTTPATEHDWFHNVLTVEKVKALKDGAATELTRLGLDFETLAWCLAKYEARGGSSLVVQFYKYRYKAVLCWLDAMDLLESHGQIQAVFKPKESRKYMDIQPGATGASG